MTFQQRLHPLCSTTLMFVFSTLAIHLHGQTGSEWPNYGGDASAKRFGELLSKDVEFREIVDQLKAANKGG